MATIRVLIVDDERPARQKIRRYLGSEPDIEIIGEASGGREAVAAIRDERPDLIFLDVQMPGLDGFGVIASLDINPLPLFVFVTAHDQFALRAFEVSALDYLLKPFDAARFKKVLDRARHYFERAGAGGLAEKLNRLLEEVRPAPRYVERLLINAEGRAFLLPVERINWIEAARNYVRVHVEGDSYLLRGTIEGLHKKLNPSRFARVNRSQVVNLESIKELQPWFHGEYKIILKDGAQINWSRRYIDRSAELFTARF
jgi:two-component system, LytTR family, response regulator